MYMYVFIGEMCIVKVINKFYVYKGNWRNINYKIKI